MLPTGGWMGNIMVVTSLSKGVSASASLPIGHILSSASIFHHEQLTICASHRPVVVQFHAYVSGWDWYTHGNCNGWQS